MFWNNSHTFYNYLKCSAQLSPSLRNRNRLCQRTATSTHFWSSRKHDIAHGNNAQDCFAISGYSVRHKIQSEVSTITRAILLQNQSSGVSNLQRGQSCEEIFDTLTTFLNPLSEWTYCMENGQLVSFLSPHRLVLFAHMRLWCYSYSTLNRFWEKTDCFAVYCCLFICIFLFPCSTAIAPLFIYLFIFHLFILIFFLIDLLPLTVNQSGDGGWKYVELTLRFH